MTNSDFADDLIFTKNWAGWSKVQQQRGIQQRPGAAAAEQPERAGLPGAGRRGAPVRAHHDQRRGAGPDEEPLDAAVPHHKPEEPRLPGDRRQHGQRGLQHQLHRPVGQPDQDRVGRQTHWRWAVGCGGRTTGCRQTSSTSARTPEGRPGTPGGHGRLYPASCRGGQATKRATQELVGDDKNFVVTTDLGSEFATLIATPRP